MTDKRSLMDLARAAAPAPHDETEDYQRFGNRFSVITLFFMIACAYLASLLPIDEAVASKILFHLPILNERSSFLRGNDIPSYLSFAATVASVLVTVPVTIAVFFRGYWITVVGPRKCRRVSQATFISVALGLSVSSILMAIAFISVPTSYDPRWPGYSVIVFWPLFPAFGAGVAWIVSIVLHSVLVGLFKAAMQYGGKNG